MAPDHSDVLYGSLGLMDQTGASWNQIASWLKQLECLRRTAV